MRGECVGFDGIELQQPDGLSPPHFDQRLPLTIRQTSDAEPAKEPIILRERGC